jgi:KDO2-lipid IV(A) lauroyltransferase
VDYQRTSYSQYTRGNHVAALVIRAVLSILSLIPYRARVAFGGMFFEYVVSPLSGNHKRILRNLDLIVPDMPAAEKKRIARKVPNNIGRTMTELFFPDDFLRSIENCPVEGPGLDALITARNSGRPVILVSGHIGNYDVVRGNVVRMGYPIGSLYKPMRNGYFNDFYLRSIMKIGAPMFPTIGKGMGEMTRHLKNGGMIALMMDQHMKTGEPLNFMGKIAYTPISAPKMALKYDAVLLPCFSTRAADGIHHVMHMCAPIEHGDPLIMAQKMNDELERLVWTHMDQWLWTHRRWKGTHPEV